MRILFATDGSAESLLAQELLFSLPLAVGTELTAVSVVPLPYFLAPAVGREGELRATEPSPRDLRQAQEVAERAAFSLAKAGVLTESLVRVGQPAEVVCRLAEERGADLVVVGSRGHSGLLRFFLGSISRSVVSHCQTPVLVVKPPARPIHKVVLGVDGSEDARRAVDFLRRFPLPPETKVIAACAVYVPAPFHGAAESFSEAEDLTAALETVRRAAESDAERVLKQTAEALAQSFSVETRLAAGLPARTLLDLAQALEADLLVVGSRGLSLVERFVMGSVSLQVSLHAQTSVLVVRGRQNSLQEGAKSRP